jgi:hypothetical protein
MSCLRLFSSLLLLGVVALTTGCASITGTTNQNVSIQTREPAGKEITGAACELSNSKGKWFITTPGSVGVTRSNDDMQVICSKAGLEPGRASVVSATKGSMFGNILLGGGVGAIIDHNTGAAYEYPSFFQVVMGTFTKVESTPSNPTPAPTDGTNTTTALAPQSGTSQSLAASTQIASPTVAPATPATAALQRRSLGIVVDDVTAAMAQALGLGDQRGVLITQVVVNGPAYLAGLAVGDVIISLNDVSAQNSETLARALAGSDNLQLVPVTVVTNRQQRRINIDFGPKPDARAQRL